MAQAPRSEFLVTVLSGPNAGASAPLRAGRTSIGGAPDDGVILDGIPAGHLSVTLGGDRVRLLARGAGARVGAALTGTAPLAPGAAQVVALPAMVRVDDDVMVNIARTVPARPRLAAGTAALVAALALAGGLLVGLQLPPETRLAADMSARAAPFAVSAEPAQTTTVPAPAQAPARSRPLAIEAPAPRTAALTATSPALDPCSGPCQHAAAAELEQRLAAAGLGGLSVSPSNGVLRVTGTLPPDRQSDWTELRRAFESERGRSLPLVVATSDRAAAPLLSVAAIWLGSRPELLTKTGQTLRVGDRTADGWTVARIARGAITLTHDGTDVSVSF